MPARIRPVDLPAVMVVLVAGAGVCAALVGTVGVDSEQARCAANLARFGEASACYQAQWGVFAPSDPWPMMPRCINPTGPHSRWNVTDVVDPVHGFLLYQMGYVPNIPPGIGPYEECWTTPWGFSLASIFLEMDGVPPVAVCPSAMLSNMISPPPDTPELDPNHDPLVYAYKHAACYTPNRLLRSPTDYLGVDRRHPRLPGANAFYDPDNDNQFATAAVHLSLPDGDDNDYYIQAVANDEVAVPPDTLYMCDSLDYSIGEEDELVDTRYGSVLARPGSWLNLHRSLYGDIPAASPLGARHGGKSNALYCDGHVSDENQTPRNRRGDLITASTFADFIDEYGIGTQHHLMPGWRWVDQTLSPPGSYAPGDDQPPTVAETWPAAGSSVSSPNAERMYIRFSEQVLINATNVTINGGTVVPPATYYDPNDASFHLLFDRALPAGDYQVVVSAAVTDRMGNQLDGDGGGTGGDAFVLTFAVRDPIVVNWREGSIQTAIDAAVDGDVIILRRLGDYGDQSIDFAGKPITIRSEDPYDPAIVAGTFIGSVTGAPVVTFQSGEGPDSVLEGVSVRWGLAGGVYIDGASPTIRRCLVEDNRSDTGAGILCLDGAPLIEACIIRDNIADYGAGLYCFNSAAIVRSCVFAENHAYEEGAAVYAGGWSEDLLINNTIVGNVADGGGLGGSAVLCLLGAHTGIFSNVFHVNSGSAVAAFDAAPSVCVNLFDAVPLDYQGNGNIAGDPQLADWPAHDYHIPPTSPCVDAGSPWYGPGPEVIDFEGERRVAYARVDIGADEINPLPVLIGSDPPAGSTLPRFGGNVVRLIFDRPIRLPSNQHEPVDGVYIYLEQYELATTNVLRDTLEVTVSTRHGRWVTLAPTEEFRVEPFAIGFCGLRGDADNSGRVTMADYSVVKAHLGEYTDARYDLDNSGHVTTADYNMVKDYLGARAPIKP